MFSEAISRFTRPSLQRFGAAGDRLFWLVYLIVLPLYLAPIFVTRILPGLDLPFHLSLVDMLHKVDLAGSPYGRIFDGTLRVSPYMGYLLVLWLLSFFGSVGFAHKLLFALYIAVMPLSLARLCHACGRSRLPALVGFPLAYNMAVHYGFMSFALALPLLLFCCAELARITEVPEAPSAWKSIVRLGGFSAALFLFHLLGYAFFLCVALAVLVLTRRGMRARLVIAAGLLPSLLLIGWWRISERGPSVAPPGPGIGYVLKQLWQSVAEHNIYDRIVALPNILLKGFSDGTDRIGASLVLVLMLGFALLGTLRARSIENDQRAKFRITSVASIALFGAVLAYLILPHHLRELDVMTLYPRFSIILGALLVLLVPAAFARQSMKALSLCAGAALIVDVYYGVQLIRHYRMFARETADFVSVLDQTPAGGKAAGLVFDRQSRVLTNESILVGLPSYYPVLRRAEASLVDILYCDMKHMPCRSRDKGLRPPVPQPWTPRELHPDVAVPYFDYFFVRKGPPAEQLFGRFANQIEVLAKAGTWVVYRKRDQASRNGAASVAPSNSNSSGSTSIK